MVKKTKKTMSKRTTKKVNVSKKKPPQKTAKQSVSSNGRSTASGVGIRPLGDRVVIRPLTEDELGTKSPSGIIIPDTVKGEKPEQGIVVAVGAGKYEDGKRVPLQVSVGDRVVFSKYGYDEVKVGGTEYYVVSESSLLAILND